MINNTNVIRRFISPLQILHALILRLSSKSNFTQICIAVSFQLPK